MLSLTQPAGPLWLVAMCNRKRVNWKMENDVALRCHYNPFAKSPLLLSSWHLFRGTNEDYCVSSQRLYSIETPPPPQPTALLCRTNSSHVIRLLVLNCHGLSIDWPGWPWLTHLLGAGPGRGWAGWLHGSVFQAPVGGKPLPLSGEFPPDQENNAPPDTYLFVVAETVPVCVLCMLPYRFRPQVISQTTAGDWSLEKLVGYRLNHACFGDKMPVSLLLSHNRVDNPCFWITALVFLCFPIGLNLYKYDR